jgi:hypothetical protein
MDLSVQQLSFGNGQIYIGQTVVSLTGIPVPHGYGTMTNVNGNYYRGNWRQGQRHGAGEQYDASTGRYYYGEFSNDREEGYATITRSGEYGETRRYEGYVRGSSRHGWGIQTEYSMNGTMTIFEGTWEYDTLQGWGRYTTTSSNGYSQKCEGMFVNGRLHGEGYVTDLVTQQRWSVTFNAGMVLSPNYSPPNSPWGWA